MLGEVENGDFTLKMHQMFSVHTKPEEFKNQQSPVVLCLRKTLACVARISVRGSGAKNYGEKMEHFPRRAKHPVPRSFFAPKPHGNACYLARN